MKKINLENSRGVTMIEVLVTILIVAFGLFGVAKFQGMVFMAGGYAKERAIASQLAQEKLDDLRSYQQLAAEPDKRGYADVAENVGGVIASGSVTVSNVGYYRTWTVSDHYYCTAGAAPSTTNCSPAKSMPDFKEITVTVAWADLDAIKQGTELDITDSAYCTTYPKYCVSLGSIIHANDPLEAVRGIVTNLARRSPAIGYTPIGVPDSVPVELKEGVKKESSKPLPDVSSKGLSTVVSFDTVTYSTLNAGYKTDRREEFATVNCVCEFNGTGTGYTPARWVWDEATGLSVQLGTQVSSRPVATAPSINGDSQDPLCAKCCRDHHDVSDTSKPLYDPERSDGFVSGDHKHYYYTDAGNPTGGLTEITNAAGNRYLEACRFFRYPEVPDVTKDFNGTTWPTLEANDSFYRSWWVFQDWRMIDLTIFRNTYLTSSLTAYTDFIIEKIKNDVLGATNPDKESSLGGRDFSLNAGQTAQLIARGVYVDKVYQKASPRTIDQSFYDYLDTISGANWLQYVPFYEVNLTLLIDWASNQPTHIAVASQPIKTIPDTSAGYYTNYYLRGFLTTGATAGDAIITATARGSNSGITGGTTRLSPSVGIDPPDMTSNVKTDTITVTRNSAVGTVAISGQINIANSSVVLSALQVSGSGATCSTVTSISSTIGQYTCTVNSGWSGKLEFSSSASGYGFAATSGDPIAGAYELNFTNLVTPPVVPTFIAYGPQVKIAGSIQETSGKFASIVGSSSINCVAIVGKKISYQCTGNRPLTGTVTVTKEGGAQITKSYSSQEPDLVNEDYTLTK